MTLLRDLIDIPERVHRDDFVLRLSEGVDRPEETLRSYVVTPQLAGAFDRALGLIRAALDSRSSKAAYLHGSFGSGKSHFMAVLHLLLQQHPAARAAEGLEGVVTRHDGWLADKRFLLVPYHMIGQPSLEAAVLGGYAARVAALHPDAPAPGVYRAEGLFADARRLREQIGDETFFARLNAASSGGGTDGWGDLAARWDAAGFEAALGAPGSAEARGRLVGALVDAFFTSYRDVVRGSGGAFVPLDDGLAVMARHARGLGYDGLVLFLDELILWLATHAADLAFLNAEGPKVSKLVEAEAAGRPIPIVSFVARQRDLRELVGRQVTGAEQLNFADVLQWWEARFEKITLEDRNLPEIAARRLLRPRGEAARRAVDRAWADTEKVRREVFETLLTPRADRAMFRQVYPFSPALVETLIAVSALLQRERTALKVMLHLLVERRETLTLGEIVPVGDLFDAIAEGDEPFTEGTRHHFEQARRLYRSKLLPLIEGRRGVTKAEAAARPGGPGSRGRSSTRNPMRAIPARRAGSWRRRPSGAICSRRWPGFRGASGTRRRFSRGPWKARRPSGWPRFPTTRRGPGWPRPSRRAPGGRRACCSRRPRATAGWRWRRASRPACCAAPGGTNGPPGRGAGSKPGSGWTSWTRRSRARGPPPPSACCGAAGRGGPTARGRPRSRRRCSPRPTRCCGSWASRTSLPGAGCCRRPSTSGWPGWPASWPRSPTARGAGPRTPRAAAGETAGATTAGRPARGPGFRPRCATPPTPCWSTGSPRTTRGAGRASRWRCGWRAGWRAAGRSRTGPGKAGPGKTGGAGSAPPRARTAPRGASSTGRARVCGTATPRRR